MLIVVLGGGIDLEGKIPQFVYHRLDKAIGLYKKKPGSKIVLSGKWSFLYKDKKPPITEAKKMAKYLKKKGILDQDILLEEKSMDTIGNAFFLKKGFFLSRGEKEAYVVTSDFQLKRAKYVFEKVFGTSYNLTFFATPSKMAGEEKKKVEKHQQKILQWTKEVLGQMRDGDDNFLAGKLYKMDYYQRKRPDWVVKFVASGKYCPSC